MPSFTTQVANLQAIGPVVEVGLQISDALVHVLRGKGAQTPSPIAVVAMIDTGATSSVIRDDIPARLGLHPIGLERINTASHANVKAYRYFMRLALPNNVIMEGVFTAAALSGQHIQCLIGRDILAHGIFIYSGYTNTFSFSL